MGRLASLVAVCCAIVPAAAMGDPPVWDPQGSAEGLAATVQEAAANPTAATETSPASDCTDQSGPVSIPAPPSDPFYTPPHPIPHGAPGTIIRIRPTCTALQGHKVPYRAWTIMYLTTGALDKHGEPSELDAEPAVATGLLIAPSYQVAIGADPDFALFQEALALGWAVVLPDYEGPDSAFSAGPLEGHAFLDGIRAAENLSTEAGLAGADTPVGMWGGSGGAIAVGWASELQPRYAPELKVAAVTEVDVPGDMRGTFNQINDGYVGPGVAFAAALGISTAYPDLLPMSMFNEAGKQLAATFRATGSNQYPQAIPPQHIEMYTACGCNPLKQLDRFPGVAKALHTVNLGQHAPAAPLFISQAWNDELMPFADTKALVKRYCDAGATVDFRVLMGDEHISHGFLAWPEALAYLTARFDGAAPIDTCSLPDNGGVTPPVDPVTIPPPLPPGVGAQR